MTTISSFVRAMVARDTSPSSFNPRLADELQEKIVRNTLITALMAGAAIYALPASAQTANTDVRSAELAVETNIPGYCSDLAALGPDDMLNLGSLANSTTGQLVEEFEQNASKELSGSFYCNAPSKVKIEVQPLTNAAIASVSDSTSFTNRVDYTASLEWGGRDLTVASTEAGGQEFEIEQATIGTMELKLSDPRVEGSRNLRPVAGDYEGKVILTISLN